MCALFSNSCSKPNERLIVGEWKCTRVYLHSQNTEVELWNDFLKMSIPSKGIGQFTYGNYVENDGVVTPYYNTYHTTYRVEGDSIIFKYQDSGTTLRCEIIELSRNRFSWKQKNWPDKLYEYNFERIK